VRRLIPALVTTVVVCTAIAGVVGGDVLVGIAAQVVGSLTFSSNWVYIAQGASYSADLSPQLFANFWSLAVEEQFYLFWPLVLLAVFAIRQSRSVGLVVTGLFAVGSAAWMAFLFDPTADPSRVYFGTDTHLFGLMAGAFFALWFAPRVPRDGAALSAGQFDQATLLPATGTLASWLTAARRRRIRLGLGGVSAAGLVVLSSTLRIDGAFTYRGGLVLASLFSVGLMAFFVRSQPFARRIEVGPLRWIGVRSYGIYLWHWPLLVLVAEALGANHPGGQSTPPVAMGALTLTFLAAWVSYRLIERPVMTYGIRAVSGGVVDRVRGLVARARGHKGDTAVPRRAARSRVQLGVGALVACAVPVALAAAFVRAPQMSSLEAEILQGALAARQSEPGRPGTAPTGEPSADASAAPVDPSPKPSATQAPPVVGPPPGDQVTVVGDSVALISVEELQADIPGIHIDAEVSRQMSETPEIAAGLRDAGLLRPFVVLSLGTNSTASEAVMNDAVNAIGADHMIVLVTGYGDRTWIGPTNDQMRAAATRYPNVVIADWQAAADAQPDVLSHDGVHPQASGQELYAQTVLGALTEANQKRTTAEAAAGS
jgi:peptidoglycan/LPS O-acetylase OafA/YrhL